MVKENFKPKACTSVKPSEVFANFKDQVVSGTVSGNSCGIGQVSHREEEKSLIKTSYASEHNEEPKTNGKYFSAVFISCFRLIQFCFDIFYFFWLGGELKQLAGGVQQPAKNSPSGTVADNQLGKEITKCQIRDGGVDRSSSSASGEMSSDDDIIIEKELKRTDKPTSLLIEDSDDDIAVCEVVDTIIINEPMLSKKQRKKLRKKTLQNQTETSAASTSTVPALDYIPLSSYRMPQKGKKNLHPNQNPHRPQNMNRAAKLQMIHDKREKKSRAARWNSIQSGKVDSSSEPKQSSASENKEKREFGGNIMNPNPENPKTGLRPVVIDASNVAIGYVFYKFLVLIRFFEHFILFYLVVGSF